MPESGTVYLGVARLELHLPGAASLKDKRAVLQRLTARLRDDLGCSVAEVGAQDLWRRAVLGVGVVASTHTGVVRVLDRLTAVAERDPRLQVIGVHDLVDTLDADGHGLPWRDEHDEQT